MEAEDKREFRYKPGPPWALALVGLQALLFLPFLLFAVYAMSRDLLGTQDIARLKNVIGALVLLGAVLLYLWALAVSWYLRPRFESVSFGPLGLSHTTFRGEEEACIPYSEIQSVKALLWPGLELNVKGKWRISSATGHIDVSSNFVDMGRFWLEFMKKCSVPLPKNVSDLYMLRRPAGGE